MNRESISQVSERLHELDERGRANFFDDLVQVFYNHAKFRAPGGEGLDGRDGHERRTLGQVLSLSTQWRKNARAEQVRMMVRETNLEDINTSGPVLFDATDTEQEVLKNVLAWAHHHRYDQLTEPLGDMFASEPPDSGYSLLINRPHSLMVIATWPKRFNHAGQAPRWSR